tara:strand:- start:3127 stop:4539 length:1413 start_codon:yes stop_codon:yes gene_type:complete
MAKYNFVPTSADDIDTFGSELDIKGIKDVVFCYNYITKNVPAGLPNGNVPINISTDTGTALFKIIPNVAQELGQTSEKSEGKVKSALYEAHPELAKYKSIIGIGKGTRSKTETVTVSFKPQDFGGLASDTKEYSVMEFIKTTQKAINERDDFSLPLKAYLKCLTMYFHGHCPASKVTAFYKKAKPYIPKFDNMIVDFGEILSPMCFLHDDISKRDPYKYSNPKVILPARGNEPLVDFYLIEAPHGKVGFSVKALKSAATNTIKPKPFIDVIEAYGTRGAVTLKSEAEKRAYNTFKTLAFAKTGYKGMIGVAMKLAAGDNAFKGKYMNVISNPGKLSSLAFNAGGTATTPLMKVIGPNRDQAEIRTLISNFCTESSRLQKYAGQTDYTLENLAYVCEALIIQANKDGILDFTNLFKEYVLKQVVYVKMDINSTTGIPSCEVLTYHNMNKSNVELRSKNSFNGYQDMIGMQP